MIALGLAKSAVAPRRGKGGPIDAELLVLDRHGRIVSASRRGRALVSELDLDGHQEIPHGIVAARRGREAGCVRLGSGAWVAFRRFDVGRRVAVLVDRATPDEIARTVLLAYRFTARERAVARLVLEGLSNVQIAHELGISLHTAKDHVKAVLAKSDSESRARFRRSLSQGA
jgi:DNA-binding CsgD family transcriptional regulator